MINALIGTALRHRGFSLALAAMVLVWGAWSFRTLPVDAYPDVSPILVQVFTETEGLAPEEVEQLITYPVETALNGLPGLQRVRSVSNFGLSVVNAYFVDGTDIYRARQLVNERLQMAVSDIPEGLGDPVMGPVSSGLGQILFYYMEDHTGERSLEELRTLQDWVVKRNLQTVRGVTEVLSIGGDVRQYDVVVDPGRLQQYDVTLPVVMDALRANNLNVGASFLEVAREEYLVRSVGLVASLEDLRSITVVTRDGVPVRVADLARVELGAETRRGLATRNGDGEVVVGFVLKLLDSNTSTVIQSVQDRLDQIQAGLPEGVEIRPYYQQGDLVERATGTVTGTLWQGLVLVLVVLVVLLGNVRSALIVGLALPFSLLFTFMVMRPLGISANLMSLGGLAIGIGMIVDAAIVVVENTFRRLRESSGGSTEVSVRTAAEEVGRPVFFAISIVIVVFLPLFTLQGVEGVMFRPLASAIALALVGSLLFSLLVAPALCLGLLGRGELKQARAPLIAWLEERYRPLLRRALDAPKVVLGATGGLLVLGLSAFPFLGTEFIPTLNEGTLLIRATMAPSIALTESTSVVERVERQLLTFPEVVQVVSRIGRGEIGAHADPVNNAEVFVELKPRNTWETADNRDDLVFAMQARLEDLPGVQLNFTQPIAAAVDELLTGIKAQIAVKLYGDDLAELKVRADEIADVLRGIEGAAEVQVEQVSGQPQLLVQLDRRALSRYGIPVAHAQEVIQGAIGGADVGEVFEGERRWSIVARLEPDSRDRPSDVGALLIDAPDGTRVPLGQVAEIGTVVGPRQISREDNQRYITVQLNVRGRDIGSFVAEAEEELASISLPTGYFVRFGGQFELAQAANRRLRVVVPITIGLILGMLFLSFGGMRESLLVVLNIPLALVGGVVALLLTGHPLSVPASVGFIALLGIAVENGLVLVTWFGDLRSNAGLSVREAVVEGAVLRLRPVIMTAATTSLGLAPLLLASGPGSEVQRPLAIAVVGGLVTSTALTLVALPVLYEWVFRRRE